jgi:hypothetical protein
LAIGAALVRPRERLLRNADAGGVVRIRWCNLTICGHRYGVYNGHK